MTDGSKGHNDRRPQAILSHVRISGLAPFSIEGSERCSRLGRDMEEHPTAELFGGESLADVDEGARSILPEEIAELRRQLKADPVRVRRSFAALLSGQSYTDAEAVQLRWQSSQHTWKSRSAPSYHRQNCFCWRATMRSIRGGFPSYGISTTSARGSLAVRSKKARTFGWSPSAFR